MARAVVPSIDDASRSRTEGDIDSGRGVPLDEPPHLFRKYSPVGGESDSGTLRCFVERSRLIDPIGRLVR